MIEAPESHPGCFRRSTVRRRHVGGMSKSSTCLRSGTGLASEGAEQRVRIRSGGLLVVRVGHGVRARDAYEIQFGRQADDERLEEIGLDAETFEEGERRPVLDALAFGTAWWGLVWKRREERRERRVRDMSGREGGHGRQQIENFVAGIDSVSMLASWIMKPRCT